MAEYISKNEVLNLIMHNDKVCHYADERYENVVYSTARNICDVVANLSAADVQPVKRGHWNEIYHDSENYSASCTSCGQPTVRRVWFRPYDFCPHCGADMRGEKNG